MPESYPLKNLATLRQEALAFTPTTHYPPEWALERLSRASTSDARTSTEHAAAYLRHLGVNLPYALEALANAEYWRIPALLDPKAQSLRKPRIRLDADINTRGTLHIRWTPVGSDGSDAAQTTREFLRFTDFTRLQTTWRENNAFGNALVRLLASEYPQGPECDEDDAPLLGQREAFEGFLASVLNLLRSALEVQVGDWLELDEHGRVVEMSLEHRMQRTAATQAEAAQKGVGQVKAFVLEKLQRADITEDELRQAIARKKEEGTSLQTALAHVTGRKIRTAGAMAAERALEAATIAEKHLAACEDVLRQARAA